MTARTLITGGAGFIGSHLADALVARGHEVVLLDSLSAQVHPDGPPDYLPVDAELVHGDVGDRERLDEALRGCQLVFHLAAETGTAQSMYEPRRYVDANVGGTAALLEALSERAGAGARTRVVLASSRAVYGEGAALCARCGIVYPATRTTAALAAGEWALPCPRCRAATEPRPTPEDAPARPSSIYGVTKHAQEELLRAAAGAGLVDVWALRLQNVYGPRQSLANPYTGLLAVFVNRLRAGQPCELFEDGECARDFIYVSDVVAALLSAADKPAGGFAAVNVGSGLTTTVREVAETLGELMGAEEPPRASGRYRAGDVRAAVAHTRRAAELLDWSPSIPLVEGLSRFLEWAVDRDGEDRSEEVLDELRRRGLGG